MGIFRETTHLSEILEKSSESPVVIFKFSSECGSSSRLQTELEKVSGDFVVYKVTVQKQPELSRKISEIFEIKHETPQIIVLNKSKVVYTAHHEDIKLSDFLHMI